MAVGSSEAGGSLLFGGSLLVLTSRSPLTPSVPKCEGVRDLLLPEGFLLALFRSRVGDGEERKVKLLHWFPGT